MDQESTQRWKPGPVVIAVFVAGVISVWVVVALYIFYDLVVEPVDVALNMAVFTTIAGWWTERMSK
jgi:hypothetical protein